MLSCLQTAFYQLVLFLFYFVYFLFKGKPEWQKVGNDEYCTTGYCCLHNPKLQSAVSPSDSSKSVKNIRSFEEQTNAVKTEVSWRRDKHTTIKTLYENDGKKTCRHMCAHYANKMAQMFWWLRNTLYSILTRIITITCVTIAWIYSVISEWLLSSRKLTPSDDSAQLIQKRDMIQTTVTEEQAEQHQQNQKQQEQFLPEHTRMEFASSYPSTEAIFQRESSIKEEIKDVDNHTERSYSRNFEQTLPESLNVVDSEAPSSSPPPPPPQPPAVAPFTPTSKLIIKDEGIIAEKAPPKGGVAVLPPDIMAEAHARVKEREQKLSVQKADSRSENKANISMDWTVTSKRYVPSEWITSTISKVETSAEGENKASEEESETWWPVKRNVVSRMPRSSGQDAQFIFCASKHHTVPSNLLPEGNFLMGRSVFSPLKEVEEMRSKLNRRLTETPSESRFSSRLDTPLEEQYTATRMGTPIDLATCESYPDRHSNYPTSRSRSQSRIHSVISPITVNQIHPSKTDEQRMNMLRQRSRTVEPRAESMVKTLSRQWPPQSNATGVQLPKDNWNIIPSELVSCRRLMERTVTDQWTTRNENGDIVDRWSAQSWKGESDVLRRCGDGSGEAWHREVDISPHGKKTFVDNRRVYTQDYVIESEARSA